MEPSTQTQPERTLLTEQESNLLLHLVRQALTKAVFGRRPPAPNLEELPESLRRPAMTFVTLTRHGKLRGCVGVLEPARSLVEDACHNAIAAAFLDKRFSPLEAAELPGLKIEISSLTRILPVAYECPEQLLERLRPGIDGVLLRQGSQCATFLPQVWESVPDPACFLSLLCQKMGVPADLWRRQKLGVSIYQVQKFQE